MRGPARLPLAALAAVLGGCVVSVDRSGDPAFLRGRPPAARPAPRDPTLRSRWWRRVILASEGRPRRRRVRPTQRLRRGMSTVEVARILGPPDDIARRFGELRFTYRYQEARTWNLDLVVYAGVKAFSGRQVDRIDTTLLVMFDSHDRLLHFGMDEGPLDRKILAIDY